MADGTRLNKGEGGDLILTDEVGSFKVEVAKVAFGPDGELTLASSANPVPSVDSAAAAKLTEVLEQLKATLKAEVTTAPGTKADGGVGLPSVVYILGGYDGTNTQALVTDSSGILQVDIANEPTVAVGGTTLTRLTEIEEDTDNLAGIKTAVETLDNIVSGSEAQVDIVSGGPITTALEALNAGATIFRSLDIDETEEEVKATAGRLLFYHYANRTSEELFLKFYNATAANVTVGSTTPVLTITLAKESQGHVPIPNGGWIFSTAISVACVKKVEDNNAEGPAANGCVINLGYA